jgi:dihydrofolate reductase
MRKVILMMSVSLDGFIEGPDRELDWHMVDDELHRHFNEELRAMDAFLSGRVTYELMAGFWRRPTRTPRAPSPWSSSPASGGTSPRSCSPGPWSGPTETPLWSETNVVPDQVMALKTQPGGDLVLSGADIAEAFMRHDLIDEYRLYVHPVVIGRGKPLFQASDIKIDLQLAEARTFRQRGRPPPLAPPQHENGNQGYPGHVISPTCRGLA